MGKVSTFELRAAGPDDAELLWEIFRSSRAGALAGLPEELVRMQHRAREEAYSAAFPGATDNLIVIAGRIAGRVLVSRTESEHRVIDIAVLPAEQGHGLGTAVLQSLAGEAAAAGKPLRLTVATNNSGALNVYRRLGFVVVRDDGVDMEMEIPAT